MAMRREQADDYVRSGRLRNKTYPLRMILSSITDYDLGYTLEETATRLKKKTSRRVSPATYRKEDIVTVSRSSRK